VLELMNLLLKLKTRQPIRGHGVVKVLDSGHPNFKKGDLVRGITGWEEYSLLHHLLQGHLLKLNPLMCLYPTILEFLVSFLIYSDKKV
jgi:NADPH-dependent curcumin reductase CurA